MNDEPILVGESAVPSSIAKAVRQILLVAGGWAIGKGYLDSDTQAAVVTVVMILLPFVYGQIKGWSLHKQLVQAADAAPDEVAQVK